MMHSDLSIQKGGVDLFRELLQPHFLFNSLNNLYALSLRGSDQTSEAIACLSHLLEKVVSFSRKKQVGLKEEMELVRDYIALERIWLGEGHFHADIQVRGEPGELQIPPLTIYTLVENAFKHGVRQSQESPWVTLYLVIKQDHFYLKVRNACCKEPARISRSTGLGIDAVRSLLDSAYEQHHHFEARMIGDVFAVDLIVRPLVA